jgi:beta-glucosidase
MPSLLQKKTFPKDFIFGVADADLQVIGEGNTLKEENSCPTMWSHFAEHSGKCHENASPHSGVDRYHRWPEDINLIQELGVSAYRCSISMSRLLTSEGEVNPKAVQWYRRYFQALAAANIKIYATLYHWELPQFLQERGGWAQRKTATWLFKHGMAAMEAFGDLIQDFFILNEPWCAAMNSYHTGAHAPGDTDITQALLAAHHLLLAQGMIVREAKTRFPQMRLGTVYNVETSYAASGSAEDRAARSLANDYFNGWFFEPTYVGQYPPALVAAYGERMPEFSAEDLELIRVGHLLDYQGINYYNGGIKAHNPATDLGYETIVDPTLGTNDLGWPVFTPPHYPEGLYDILCELYHRYQNAGMSNLMITENGMALSSAWDGKSQVVPDPRRISYLREHLGQAYKALLKGVPLTAYFAWTLMDNYEWAEGYRPESCFGMVHVTRDTLTRIPKESYYWYQSVAMTGQLGPQQAETRPQKQYEPEKEVID